MSHTLHCVIKLTVGPPNETAPISDGIVKWLAVWGLWRALKRCCLPSDLFGIFKRYSCPSIWPDVTNSLTFFKRASSSVLLPPVEHLLNSVVESLLWYMGVEHERQCTEPLFGPSFGLYFFWWMREEEGWNRCLQAGGESWVGSVWDL